MSPRTTRIRSCLAQRTTPGRGDRAAAKRRDEEVAGGHDGERAVGTPIGPRPLRSCAQSPREVLTMTNPTMRTPRTGRRRRRHCRRTGSCAVQLHAWAHATRAHPRTATHGAARVARAPTGPGPARGALGTHRRTNDGSTRDGRDSAGARTRSVSLRAPAEAPRWSASPWSVTRSRPGAEERRALATATTRRAASPTGPRPARCSGCLRTRTPRPIRRFGEQATIATGHPHPTAHRFAEALPRLALNRRAPWRFGVGRPPVPPATPSAKEVTLVPSSSAAGCRSVAAGRTSDPGLTMTATLTSRERPASRLLRLKGLRDLRSERRRRSRPRFGLGGTGRRIREPLAPLLGGRAAGCGAGRARQRSSRPAPPSSCASCTDLARGCRSVGFRSAGAVRAAPPRRSDAARHLGTSGGSWSPAEPPPSPARRRRSPRSCLAAAGSRRARRPAPPDAAAWTTHRRRRAASIRASSVLAPAGRQDKTLISPRGRAGRPRLRPPHLLCLQTQGGRAVEERWR